MGFAYERRLSRPATPLPPARPVSLSLSLTSVTAEYLFVDNRGDRQTVETIRKRFPQFDVVPALACVRERHTFSHRSFSFIDSSRLTFVVETVYAIDARALVVAAQQEEILGILDLKGEEKTNCFERLLAPIDVIAEKEIVRFGRKAAVLEQSQ